MYPCRVHFVIEISPRRRNCDSSKYRRVGGISRVEMCPCRTHFDLRNFYRIGKISKLEICPCRAYFEMSDFASRKARNRGKFKTKISILKSKITHVKINPRFSQNRAFLLDFLRKVSKNLTSPRVLFSDEYQTSSTLYFPALLTFFDPICKRKFYRKIGHLPYEIKTRKSQRPAHFFLKKGHFDPFLVKMISFGAGPQNSTRSELKAQKIKNFRTSPIYPRTSRENLAVYDQIFPVSHLTRVNNVLPILIKMIKNYQNDHFWPCPA